MKWPMGVVLSCESGCARSFVRRRAIGRSVARPVVIDISAPSASCLRVAGPAVQLHECLSRGALRVRRSFRH